MAESFPSFLVEKDDAGVRAGFKDLTLADLPDGDVVVKVHCSGVNFKDGLATIPTGNVARSYPLVPGIDLAGTVVQSSDPRVREGDEVLATGYDLGVSHHGGYARYARLPAGWVVPLPRGLTSRDAMAIGTAGLTAARAIVRLEENGLRPGNGPVLVTGATGGVGCLAVDMLSHLGYTVEASTGKGTQHDFLRSIGAKEVLPREELLPEKARPLDRQRWAAAIDPVGGKTLSTVLSRLLQGGSAASVGLTGGPEIETTVFPFILRGANLLGIDSAYLPMAHRRILWDRLAGDLRPPRLHDYTEDVPFGELPATLERILGGGMRGRAVVRME
jgi:putative YhdH/YhfP family quinone oxidoreductase